MNRKNQQRLIERILQSKGLAVDEAYEASLLFLYSGREPTEIVPASIIDRQTLRRQNQPPLPPPAPPLGMEMYS